MNTSSIKKWSPLALILLIIIGVSVFVLMPQINRLSAVRNSLTGNQTKLDDANAKLDSLKAAKNDSEHIKTIADTVNNLWPDKEDVSQFIVQSEGLAKANQMELSNVSISRITIAAPKKSSADDTEGGSATATKTAKKAQTAVKFSFESKTSYSNAYNFIAGMEKLARFNSIGTVNLSGDDAGAVSLKLSGLIYGP